MGLADLVPGVSGGTIAFLYGIYDELLYSIKHLTSTTLRLLLQGNVVGAWRSIPFGFLVPVFVGIVVAIFGLSSVVSHLLDTQPVLLWSFFFGLVISSALIIAKRIKRWNGHLFGWVAVGALLTYLIVGFSSTQATNHSPLALFLTGAVAFCAMILPGISGSLIMLILGQYEHVIDSVSTREVGTLVFLGLGGVVGLAFFARLLSWLLKHHHAAMLAFLIGMMLGSLRKLWPWQTVAGPEETSALYMPSFSWSVIAALVVGCLGFFIITRLEKLGITEEHEDIDEQALQDDLGTKKTK